MTMHLSPQSLLQDPLRSSSLVASHMTISTKSPVKPIVSGYFYCIDPQSGIIVLLNPGEPANKISVQMVYSHAINTITVDTSNVLASWLMDEFNEKIKPKTAKDFSPEELNLKKKSLIEILRKAQLPYEESSDGQVIVASVATVDPPYHVGNIKCDSGIVYSKLKAFMSNPDQPVG